MQLYVDNSILVQFGLTNTYHGRFEHSLPPTTNGQPTPVEIAREFIEKQLGLRSTPPGPKYNSIPYSFGSGWR